MFSFGSGVKKDRGTGFLVLAEPEMKREPKMKEGEAEGKEGNISSFLPHPLPALLLPPFFARSLTLVPCSLTLNHKETLATQANYYWLLKQTCEI